VTSGRIFVFRLRFNVTYCLSPPIAGNLALGNDLLTVFFCQYHVIGQFCLNCLYTFFVSGLCVRNGFIEAAPHSDRLSNSCEFGDSRLVVDKRSVFSCSVEPVNALSNVSEELCTDRWFAVFYEVTVVIQLVTHIV